jgi:hypothetical protein
MGILIVLAIFVAFALAGALGLTADSHDSADWRPTNNGFRQPRTF